MTNLYPLAFPRGRSRLIVSLLSILIRFWSKNVKSLLFFALIVLSGVFCDAVLEIRVTDKLSSVDYWDSGIGSRERYCEDGILNVINSENISASAVSYLKD